MNRLYVVESTPRLTGAMADHRIPLGPNGIADLLREIRAGLEPNGSNPLPAEDKFVSALVGDLRQYAGKSLVSPVHTKRPRFKNSPGGVTSF